MRLEHHRGTACPARTPKPCSHRNIRCQTAFRPQSLSLVRFNIDQPSFFASDARPSRTKSHGAPRLAHNPMSPKRIVRKTR